MKNLNHFAILLTFLGFAFFTASCDSFLSTDKDMMDYRSQPGSVQNLPATGDQLLLEQYIIDPLDPIDDLIGESERNELLEKVLEEGRLRVINRLDVSFTPEGLLTEDEVQRQRRNIQVAQDELLAAMSLLDISAVKRFQFIPFIAMEVNHLSLLHLIDSPLVLDITEDIPEPPALVDSAPLVGADKAWEMGYTGNGYAIAFLDTGVDPNHSFFGNRIINQACFSSNSSNSNIESLCPNREEESFDAQAGRDCDSSVSGCDHGTLVAGIAAGQGEEFSGVAKESQIISVQIYSRFNNQNDCGFVGAPCVRSFRSDQMRALEWVYELRRSHDISSVNLSTAGGQFSEPCNGDPRKSAIDNLRSSYIATVISSGNHGSANALSAPACISTAISVGSTTKADRHSSFSNNAAFLDLLAPGSSIRSAVPGGGFSTASGTSMAAPHVAGAWAVVRHSNPAANVAEVLQLLSETGVPVQNNNNGRAKPRIQVDAAVGDAPDAQIIYEDGLVEPWINASWNASVDFTSTGRVYSGSRSIRVDQGAWGALSVRNESWESTVGIKHKSIVFALYPEETVTIDVMLENDEGASFPRIRYGTFEPGEWVEIAAAMSDLNPDGRTVHRINIMESSGVAKIYHVDGWHLKQEELPPADSKPSPDPEDPETLIIYDEGLSSPWVNASWSASIDFNNTEQAYTGTESIRIDQNSWGGLSVNHGSWNSPMDIQPGDYGQVEFAVYPESESALIDLQLGNSDGASFPRVRYGTVNPGDWTVISMPMAELNPNGHIIHRVNIMESSGQVKSYYVDAWRLSGSVDGQMMTSN